jgi:hypothetical protein
MSIGNGFVGPLKGHGNTLNGNQEQILLQHLPVHHKHRCILAVGFFLIN